MATRLRNLRIDEGSLVDEPANKHAHVVLFKRNIDKAVWTTAYINDLPDSAFAHISEGGEKDDEGKTKPRSLRHLPYKDAEGNIDSAHVRNALARLSQTDISAEAKQSARRKLLAAAKEVGIETGEDTQKADTLAGTMRKWMQGLAKRLGLSDDEVDKVMGESTTYTEEMEEAKRRKAVSELWDMMYALQNSFTSIMGDPAADHHAMMQQSVAQFTADLQMAIPKWMNGESVQKVGRAINAERMMRLREMRAMLAQMIAEAGGDDDDDVAKGHSDSSTKQRRSDDNMKTMEDILKGLSDADKAVIQAELAKRDPKPNETVTKRMEALEAQTAALAKRAEDAEGKLAKAESANAELSKSLSAEREIRVSAEYLTKAKQFPHAGSPDEVSAMLRKADEAGIGEQLVKSLQAQHQQIEQSGLFDSIGKASHGETGDAWNRIEKRAAEIAKTQNISHAKAIDQYIQSPEGRRDYAEYNHEKGAN